VSAACALLAACATTSPAARSALGEARQAVQTLEGDPLATQAAGKPLEEARDALSKAEQADAAHRPPEEIIHLSYLAKRHADIGEAQIAESRAHTQMQQAEGQREQILLQAREREAQAAEQKARDAQAAAGSAQEQARTATAQAQATQAELQALQAKQTERGMVLTLGNSVLFDSGSDALKAGATDSLDRVSQFLQNHASIKVRIEGHTDSIGGDDYNQGLSERRAQAVARELQSHAVPTERIQALGRGKQRPVASNASASGRQQNRRVEIIFSDENGAFVGGT
jgi:outer membrane protein OmpA-like peptidoglycan-associated protein